MKTFVPKKESITRNWYIIDAKDLVVGRLSTEAAKILRGKNKPDFTPHLDTGDGVIVINSEKVRFTGAKWAQKKYYRYSGYVGNVKEKTAEKRHSENPTFIVEHSIAGMIPKTKFKNDILKRLKVYPGDVHPHEGQQPIELSLS